MQLEPLAVRRGTARPDANGIARPALAAILLLVALPAEAAPRPPSAEPGPRTRRDPGASDPPSLLVEASNAYALELYAKLAATDGNLIVSPHASYASLALVLAGARGRTASELERVLHVPPLPGDRREAFHAALAALRARILEGAAPPEADGTEAAEPAPGDGEDAEPAEDSDEAAEAEDAADPGRPRLALGAALWGQTGTPWVRETLDLLARHHGAAFREVDIRAAPERAREAIDAWVSGATAGRIREAAPSLTATDGLDGLFVASAAWFRGRWESEFEPSATRPARFRVSAARSVEVPTMRHSKPHRYVERANLQALELDYRQGPFSMVVLLPKSRDGLRGLERDMTPERVAGWLAALEPRQVDVSLPRFRTECALDLSGALRALGARTVLSDWADLSGFAEPLRPGGYGCRLRCSAHRAIVSVDEEGTEAAATELEVITFYGETQPVVFRADRPFVYLIRHRETGAILFIGRLVDPDPSSGSAGPGGAPPGRGRTDDPNRQRARDRVVGE